MPSRPPDRTPNVLVVTCHDLGRFLGCYGVPTARTPHLDRLAAEGVRCERAFCAAPQCSPSRAALFTGRAPHSNGVLGLTHASFAWDLHPEERHLGQVLGEAGYETAVIGIHHESITADRCGMEVAGPPMPGEGISDAALTMLRRYAAGERPFFLHLGYVEPHRLPGPDEPDYMGFVGDYMRPDTELGVSVPPYLRDDALARQEMAELQGAGRYLDTAVGRVLDGLDELGLTENTLVLFTPDHGVALPRAKCSLYDPGLEVALIARWPARGWTGGRTLSPLVSNIDVFPTLLEAVGLPAPESVQGRSLLPLLDGHATEHHDAIFGEMTYHDYYDPRRCVRTARHKLIVNFSAAPAFMDPSQSWRPRSLTVEPADPATAYHPLVELYDLADDPYEWRNLADDPANAEVRCGLLTRLHDWMRATDDPILHGAVTSPMHRRATATLAPDAIGSDPREISRAGSRR